MTLAKHLLRGLLLSAALVQAVPAQQAAEGADAGAATEAAPETTAATVEATADTVVATVNGTEITVGHMIVALARLPQQYQQLPDEVLFPGILDQLIQQLAIGATGDGSLSAGSALALENERRQFLAAEVLGGLSEGAVTEEALQALYTERYAEAEPSREYNASHILVETEEEAAAIKAEVEGGADFAALALEKSTGPSGPNGGDLGWFGPGMMVEPFEQAVMGLEPGQVSDPVQTQFGWHVIRLNETRMKEAPELDAVREELTSELQTRAVDAAVAAATEAAEIVRNDAGIDPSVLRNLDLVAN
jgi:peptidyl-prolyl cis-trans isomerase C